MRPLIRRFNDLKLSSKFLAFTLTVFVVAMVLSGSIYYLVKQTIRNNIHSELENTTKTVRSLVQTATDVSIKNYLRAAADKNKELVTHCHSLAEQGRLTESQAKERAKRLLLSQGIGKTGYIYCLDSQGTAVVHPNEAVEGRNFQERGFIRKQIDRKQGYLEYTWQNPGESGARPKALYMSYFEPWDWIISVTSYRTEFTELVQVEDFRERVLSLRFGQSGYCYIIDAQGKVIVHPHLEGNLYDVEDATGHRFVAEMCRKRSGMVTYYWKNPGEAQAREKLVLFESIPELDWIVASSSYMSEVYAPLDRIGCFILVLLGGFLLLILSIALWLRYWVTAPLGTLMERMAVASDGDLSVRMQPRSGDEIGDVARYFNAFMDRLLKSRRALRAEIRERRLAERKYRSIFDNTDLGIFRVRSGGVLTEANPALAKMLGFQSVEDCLKHSETVSRTLFGSDDSEADLGQDLRDIQGQRTYEKSLPGPEGGIVHCLVHVHFVRDALLAEEYLEGFVQDITDLKRAEEERRNLERQLSQAQKLEAVGTLAGGIAHEFNNILQAIYGNVQLLLSKLPPEGREYKYALELDNSSRRAGELVRHLLTFSHKSEPKWDLVDLNECIAYSLDLLRRTLPKSVNLVTSLQEDLSAVLADSFQLEQIMVNLVKNAADAMPDGGTVTIETRDVRIGPEDRRVSLGLAPGGYVRLVVEDTGQGMEEATREKVFDPFFTTKEVGKGTGLGLSMVYKMIVSMDGQISVSSEPGRGTAVEILLPAHERFQWEAEDHAAEPLPGTCGESILVVDDEPALLDVAREALLAQGYCVQTAESCEEALGLIGEDSEQIDLIVLDVGLPGMGGGELLKALQTRGIQVKVLLSSGYSEEDLDLDFRSHGVGDFLSKPYTLNDLLAAVRGLLDA